MAREPAPVGLAPPALATFCPPMPQRHGYCLGQRYSPRVVGGGDAHDELNAIAQGCITRNHAHHYLGFADTQWALYEKQHELKPLLYAFRVLNAALISAAAPVCLDQLPIPADTNEMGFFQDMVRSLLSVYGRTGLIEVLFPDAGMTSQSNARFVNDQQLGYVMALKVNQPELLR